MPTFTYNLNIPNGPNNPSSDQPLMQTNTNSINSIINVDHFPFQSVGSQDGYHKQVSLVNESAPGVPANANGVLFSNTDASGSSWPFWQNSGGVVQLISQIPNFANGITSLPGGFILQFGSVALPGTSNPTGTVNFINHFTAAVVPFIYLSLQANVNTSSSNTIALLGTPTNSSFQWLFTGSTSYNNFNWLAIGH